MKKLLIVDDEPVVCDLVEATLGGGTYEVLKAGDGAAALALIRAQRPNLVLLDVAMPRMDGFAACRAIKGDPVLGSTPVVMLTACTAPSDRAQAVAAGADEYLTKPFSPLELLQVIDRLLSPRT